MALTKEQLLQPRYKVISDYPDSCYSIGIILTMQQDIHGSWFYDFARESGVKSEPESFFLLYPMIFKKLEWWEERKAEDMPEHVQYKIYPGSQCFKVDHWVIYKLYQDTQFEQECIGIRSPNGIIGAHALIPISKEEYEAYINSKQK